MRFLGVDGGQTGTTALVGDEHGRVTGHGRGGTCHELEAAIRDCVGQAAGSLDVPFRAACLGFSGGTGGKEPILRQLLTVETMTLTTDMTIALTGATNGRPGIITNAGTGTFAFGRNAAGRTARAGGWGYLFGDEGGAFDTARQALRAILRQHEGWGPPTALHDRLLAETGARDANDLLHCFYAPEWPRPRIAALAKLVDAVALEGDPVAIGILDRQAAELAGFVRGVHGQLFQPGDPVPVAIVGGVWRSRRLRESFTARIAEIPGAEVTDPVYGPAAGALLDAYRSAGLAVTLSNVPSEKA